MYRIAVVIAIVNTAKSDPDITRKREGGMYSEILSFIAIIKILIDLPVVGL
jgi:hypothetical protein